MSKYLYTWWTSVLTVGFEKNSHNLENSRGMIINGLSVLVLLVCLIHTIFFVMVDVQNKWQTLYAVPVYLMVFIANSKRKYWLATMLFTYGSYFLISFWAFENRRTGAEYGLMALATSVALVESNKFRAYMFFGFCTIAFALYKIYDFNQPFVPDDALNYELIQNSIIFSCGIIIFIQLIVFRNLTEHFADEASNQYDQLRRALEVKKQTEEKLKTTNKDLQQLRDQLEWIVKQKTTELQTYLDAININIYSSINDIKGNFVKVNEPFTQQSGYTSNELIGKNMSLLNPGDYSRTFFQDIERTVSTGQTWRGEMKLKSKSGEIYWTDQVIIPIKGKGDRVNYLLTLALPITERKLQEESREKTIKLLESIAFKTSHKVRGPMARIQGLVGLVQNDLISEGEVKSVTKLMSTCCDELNTATSDLVKFVNEHHDRFEQKISEMQPAS